MTLRISTTGPEETRKRYVAGEAASRISKKIRALVESGEVPNTPAGRKRAAGIAYSMEREGRLTKEGAYIHAKSARGRAHGR